MKKYKHITAVNCRHILLLAMTLFVSCGAENEYSNRSACYFRFDNSVHQDNTLSTALGGMGTFCYIYQKAYNGADCIFFENNQSLSSYKVKNAVDQRQTIELGLNNGIIVGCSNLNFDDSGNPILYAYDHQCPNCSEGASIYKFPLTMTNDGKAKCAKCGRIYDMNNGGIVISGSGNKMLRYHATCMGGALGILIVSN